MGWLQDIGDFLKGQAQGIIPGGKQMQAGKDLSQAGAEGIVQNQALMQALFGQMINEYQGYTGKVEDMFGESPQIDLSNFMSAIEGHGQQGLDFASQYAGDISSSIQQTQEDVGGYQKGMLRSGQSMLEELLGGAGKIDELSGESLEKSLGSYDEYLSGMKSMARTDMPGMDVYRGQIGSQASQSLQQLKDIGGLSGGSAASILNSQADQQRQLAVQSSQYKASRQDALNQAFANYGQMSQDAYSNRIGAVGQAAQMRGAGHQGLMGAQQSAAGLSMGLGQMQQQGAQAQFGMQSSALQQAQQAQLASAGLGMEQFNINQMTPYQQQLAWNQSQAQAMNPYQTGMGMYGDFAGLDYAQWSTGVQAQDAAGDAKSNIMEMLKMFM